MATATRQSCRSSASASLLRCWTIAARLGPPRVQASSQYSSAMAWRERPADTDGSHWECGWRCK
eukprot:2384404-Pyramimonas_sp.AAC.1